MEILFKYLLVFASGLAAGFINIMAGGGSLITLPLLIFIGLPSSVANGTNRVAVLVQNSVGLANFHSKGHLKTGYSFEFSIPVVIGSAIGSFVSAGIPDKLFNKILAVVMIMVIILTVVRPGRKRSDTNEKISLKGHVAANILFFFIGLYSGFIQAGVGLLIIAVLSLTTGLSLLKINGIKLFVIAASMVVSITVFAFKGKIDIIAAVVLSTGNAMGAWASSHVAIKKGDAIIKVFLIISVVAMAVKLLFFNN